MFLLDTNVVSNLRRNDRADPHVLAWVRSVQGALFLSVITVLELRIGALLLLRKDAVQAKIYATWIDGTVLPEFADRILAVTLDVVERCAQMHVPDKKPERDAFIAATALVHNLTLVTRNTRDFIGTGVRLFNPWEPT